MTIFDGGRVYEKMGVTPAINALGSGTIVGGSTPAPEVKAAMDNADLSFVQMEEMMQKSGEFLAGRIGCEAAYITSGAATAMTLSAAACITRADPEKIRRLPNTAGFDSQIVMQKAQRYEFDRSYELAGAEIADAGDENACTPEQLEATIGPETVAVAYFEQPGWPDSVLTLDQTIEVARSRSVPVIVDAASRIFPLDYFQRLATSGDLVCFGGKYIGAPHSTGFVAGRKELVEAAAANGFVAFHTERNGSLGRIAKIDRQEIVGLAAAVDLWFSVNHEDRLMESERRISVVADALEGIEDVEARSVMTEHFFGPMLEVRLDTAALGTDAIQVAKNLEEGSPRVMVGAQKQDLVTVNVHTLSPGEEEIVAARLREALIR